MTVPSCYYCYPSPCNCVRDFRFHEVFTRFYEHDFSLHYTITGEPIPVRSSKYTGGPTRSPGMLILINFQEGTDECRLVLRDGKASREVKRLDATGAPSWLPHNNQGRDNNNQVILARALQDALVYRTVNPPTEIVTVNIGKVS